MHAVREAKFMMARRGGGKRRVNLVPLYGVYLLRKQMIRILEATPGGQSQVLILA
jgi:hypothetical protein